MQPMPLEVSEIVLRLGLASLLGGLVGLERDIHGRAAGLRTHLLVSLGSPASSSRSGPPCAG